LIDSKMILEVD